MSVAGSQSPHFDGIDLWPLFTQEESISTRGLYWEHGKSQAFRKGPWKLLRIQTKKGIESKLFNLERDISESNNLATKNPAQLAAMIDEANASRTSSIEFTSFLDRVVEIE